VLTANNFICYLCSVLLAFVASSLARYESVPSIFIVRHVTRLNLKFQSSHLDGSESKFHIMTFSKPATDIQRAVNVSLVYSRREIWVIRNDCRSLNNLPPFPPDAIPCDFFLWGYVKDQVYVPPLLPSIPELKVRIRTAIETITADMLQTIWNELYYRVHVCRITNGAHIEHL